jgi:hypothetical protein
MVGYLSNCLHTQGDVKPAARHGGEDQRVMEAPWAANFVHDRNVASFRLTLTLSGARVTADRCLVEPGEAAPRLPCPTVTRFAPTLGPASKQAAMCYRHTGLINDGQNMQITLEPHFGVTTFNTLRQHGVDIVRSSFTMAR